MGIKPFSNEELAERRRLLPMSELYSFDDKEQRYLATIDALLTKPDVTKRVLEKVSADVSYQVLKVKIEALTTEYEKYSQSFSDEVGYRRESRMEAAVYGRVVDALRNILESVK